MKPEDQRIAISEACGWKYTQGSLRPWRNGEKGSKGHRLYIPDYLNDLNAMHEAEKTLELKEKYYWTLAEVIEPMTLASDLNFKFIHAAAAQRAEAFLKTLNLWLEEPTK